MEFSSQSAWLVCMRAWVKSSETHKTQCGGSQLQSQHMEVEAEGFFFLFLYF